MLGIKMFRIGCTFCAHTYSLFYSLLLFLMYIFLTSILAKIENLQIYKNYIFGNHFDSAKIFNISYVSYSRLSFLNSYILLKIYDLNITKSSCTILPFSYK